MCLYKYMQQQQKKEKRNTFGILAFTHHRDALV